MKKLLILLFLVSCADNEGFNNGITGQQSSSSTGHRLYTQKCISCHNRDPRLKGSVGPDIADATYELVEAKTQRREYPPGYTPKRKTKIMPKIPLTEKEILSILGYINSFTQTDREVPTK